jgi:hypothetical protein
MTAVRTTQAEPIGAAVEVHAGSPAPAVPEQATGPAAMIDLIRYAIEQKIPVEALERLQAMHERASDRAAAAEFAQAVATFQASCPPIAKKSTAKLTTKSGVSFSYKYAELDEIARTVRPILQKVGLSYAWDSTWDGKLLTCDCTLRHINGHHEKASFACPIETAAGMSEQQKHAAALTYARRQSLIQILGLTTCDPDLDGGNPATITDDQAVDLQALLEEKGLALPRFLKWAGVKKLTEIKASDFAAVLNTVRTHGEKPARKETAK